MIGLLLVFAGFFLVRYTIEAGLFGPAARSVTATLFAGLLIAISIFGARLPKIGDRVSYPDGELEIVAMDGRRVAALRVHRRADAVDGH